MKMAVVYYNTQSLSDSDIGEQKMRLLYVCQAETLIPTAMHAHAENLELQYISSGKAQIRIDGQTYRVKRGDIVIYNAGVLHDECADTAGGFSFYNFGIKNFKTGDLPKNHLLPKDIKPVLNADTLSGTVETLFRELFEQIARKKVGGNAISHHLANALLIMLLKQVPHEKLIVHNKSDRSFWECKAFLDTHFTENISMETMSAMAHMSMSGFAHHFKKVFGIAPGQYLIQLRIGMAQRYLITTDKNITEISMALGYDNVSHFNNQFKQIVGSSPQKYRKLWVGNEQFKNLNHIYSTVMRD